MSTPIAAVDENIKEEDHQKQEVDSCKDPSGIMGINYHKEELIDKNTSL